MNTKIESLLKELGEEIKNDATVVKYREARDKYLDDMALMGKINEFNALQGKLEEEARKADVDQKAIADLNAKAIALRDEIYANTTFSELQALENEINKILTAVNEEIMKSITGEDPHSCGGGCSSCSGCH